MNVIKSQTRALTEVYWSGTVLNIYTIGLMLAYPFLCAYLWSSGHYASIFIVLVLVLTMAILSTIKRPLLAYDPQLKRFISPEAESLDLDQIEAIEMDVRDIYFITKSQSLNGWHLSQRGWVLTPRRVILQLAKEYGWPVKDITHPISRFGMWFVP